MNTTMRKDQNADKAREQAGQAVDKAREAAGTVADKARDAAGTVADKARDVASHAGEAISHAATAVGHKAEDATAAVGSGIQHLADKARDMGPDKGMLGSATQSVASTLDEAGRYIEQKNLSGMMDDVTGLIKRNPIPAVLIGLGVGFLLGRTLRS